MPVLGVLDQPITKERWVGAAGQQTTLNGGHNFINLYVWSLFAPSKDKPTLLQMSRSQYEMPVPVSR